MEMEEQLNKVKEYLGKLPVQFCIIYREVEGELKVQDVTLIEPLMIEDSDKLAAKYLKVAIKCNQDKKIRMTMDFPRKPLLKLHSVEPVNRIQEFQDSKAPKKLIKRWRTIVFGSIHIRKVEYVVITRILMSDQEGFGHIAHIKSICGIGSPLKILGRWLKFRQMVVVWVRKIFQLSRFKGAH